MTTSPSAKPAHTLEPVTENYRRAITGAGHAADCYWLPVPRSGSDVSYIYVSCGNVYIGYHSREEAGNWIKFPWSLLDAIDRAK